MIDRRRFLASSVALLGTSLLGPRSIARALAAGPSDEFFVFVHAAGGWDVSLWADPRNERHGIVEPASTDNTEVAAIKRWVDVPLEGGTRSFRVLEPKGTSLRLGPGIGDLVDLADRLCIVNGLSMNTVSHPDGTAFSITGRHLSGGRSPQSSVEVMIANELGVGQLFPRGLGVLPLFLCERGSRAARSPRGAARGRSHRRHRPLARSHRPLRSSRRPR